MSSADKYAFFMEAPQGPVQRAMQAIHKLRPSLKRRLTQLFGSKRVDENFASFRNQHFHWMREGAKRETAALVEICRAVEKVLGVRIDPQWIIDEQLSPIEFAEKYGYSEIDYDYAMQDMKLNQAQREPERLSEMGLNDRMPEGIWLVERSTDEQRKTRVSTCIFATTEKMLDYRRRGKSARSSYFAYLFVPFGGTNKNRSRRPRITKYVGRGALVSSSLVFKFASEGRVPPDEAHMWIMATSEDPITYEGGYVSKNIDKNNRPGVRWIRLTHLTSDVTIATIDEYCARYVRSAEELAAERAAKPNGSQPTRPPVTPSPKDVMKKAKEPPQSRVPPRSNGKSNGKRRGA